MSRGILGTIEEELSLERQSINDFDRAPGYLSGTDLYNRIQANDLENCPGRFVGGSIYNDMAGLIIARVLRVLMRGE